MSDVLSRHRKVWEKKKIIRVIFYRWFNKIVKDLNEEVGRTIELGSGTGNFKDFKTDIITSDIDEHEWLDMCFDAHDMPFKDHSVGNLVLIDVLHHLANPINFFKEASRVLAKGGRVILIEPFSTLFSSIVYKKFHPEPFIVDVDYFKKDNVEDKDPWDANQAISYLLFYKNKGRFLREFKDDFIIRKRQLMSCLLYPLSGGFENKALVPDFSIPLLKLSEFILVPFRRLLAFRCYIVLEKR